MSTDPIPSAARPTLGNRSYARLMPRCHLLVTLRQRGSSLSVRPVRPTSCQTLRLSINSPQDRLTSLLVADFTTSMAVSPEPLQSIASRNLEQQEATAIRNAGYQRRRVVLGPAVRTRHQTSSANIAAGVKDSHHRARPARSSTSRCSIERVRSIRAQAFDPDIAGPGPTHRIWSIS